MSDTVRVRFALPKGATGAQVYLSAAPPASPHGKPGERVSARHGAITYWERWRRAWYPVWPAFHTYSFVMTPSSTTEVVPVTGMVIV